MKQHFDIAVIGAGPAGANFARLARLDQKMLVFSLRIYSAKSF